MRRLVTLSVVMLAAALGGPTRAEVLIGMAGPITGKDAWFGEQMDRKKELSRALLADMLRQLGLDPRDLD